MRCGAQDLGVWLWSPGVQSSALASRLERHIAVIVVVNMLHVNMPHD
jgi:hypothetical protein